MKNNNEAIFLVVMIGLLVVLVGVLIFISYMFCRSLSLTLHQVSPRNRVTEPTSAYFLMIPCFSIIWIFIFFPKYADSLENEYRARRWRRPDDFCRQMGLWYGICGVLSVIPYVGSIAGIGSLVLFILIWIKSVGYRRELEDDRPSRRGDDDDDYDDRRDDDYDDRPRRRRRRDDDDDYDRVDDDR